MGVPSEGDRYRPKTTKHRLEFAVPWAGEHGVLGLGEHGVLGMYEQGVLGMDEHGVLGRVSTEYLGG